MLMLSHSYESLNSDTLEDYSEIQSSPELSWFEDSLIYT